jgi:hypothetical protein
MNATRPTAWPPQPEADNIPPIRATHLAIYAQPMGAPGVSLRLGERGKLPTGATLQLTFPPLADRPPVAKVPAFWQRLELSRFSLDLKTAMLACGTLLASILYPLGK